MAFKREKRVKGHSYHYLVENYRQDGRVRQRILQYWGRAGESPVTKAYRDNNIGTVTPIIAEELARAERQWPADWIMAAIREAVVYKKLSLAYILGVLEAWQERGGPNARKAPAADPAARAAGWTDIGDEDEDEDAKVCEESEGIPSDRASGGETDEILLFEPQGRFMSAFEWQQKLEEEEGWVIINGRIMRAASFDQLTSKEQRVLELRLGLEDGKHRTMRETANELHVCASWVRELEVKALNKLYGDRLSLKERRERFAEDYSSRREING